MRLQLYTFQDGISNSLGQLLSAIEDHFKTGLGALASSGQSIPIPHSEPLKLFIRNILYSVIFKNRLSFFKLVGVQMVKYVCFVPKFHRECKM